MPPSSLRRNLRAESVPRLLNEKTATSERLGVVVCLWTEGRLGDHLKSEAQATAHNDGVVAVQIFPLKGDLEPEPASRAQLGPAQR